MLEKEEKISIQIVELVVMNLMAEVLLSLQKMEYVEQLEEEQQILD